MAENFASGPGPVTVGGQTFLVNPLNDDVATSLNKWVRQAFKKMSPLALIISKLGNIPAQFHAAILAEATKAELRPEPTLEERSFLLQTPEAAAFLLWLLARPNHPELKLEDVQALVTDANFGVVWADIDAVAGLKDYKPGKG